jgi:hypothetical protein
MPAREVDLGDDEALNEAANERHPLNALVPEYHWKMALERARMEPNTSVSDIVRRALRQYLERDEAFEHLDQWARNAIRLEMQTKLARPELTHSGGD